MSRRRNAKKLPPAPEGSADPDNDVRLWRGRRQKEATPSTVAEQPLDFFSKENVEARVAAWITARMNKVV